MMRTATLTLAAALAFLGAQAAHATDPCDHFVLVGSFANRAGALARAREIPGASVTFGNTAIPMFTPGRWHVPVGPLHRRGRTPASEAPRGRTSRSAR
jgi:hypothetical protein